MGDCGEGAWKWKPVYGDQKAEWPYLGCDLCGAGIEAPGLGDNVAAPFGAAFSVWRYGYDRSRERKNPLSETGWPGIWRDSEAAWAFGKYGKKFLQAKPSLRDGWQGAAFGLPPLREADGDASKKAEEEILL